MLCLKIAGLVANNVDPDEMLHSAASHLGLHCLLRPVFPNTYDRYGINKGTILIIDDNLTTPYGIYNSNKSILLRGNVSKNRGKEIDPKSKKL